MPEQPSISDVISDITADVKTIIQKEIALAKAELAPQAKKAGIGAGMFAVAALAAVVALLMLFIAGSYALAAIFVNVMSPVWAYCLGFLSMAVILLILAAILALIGKGQVKVTGPESAIQHANASVDAVKSAVARGQANVEALASGGDRALPAGGGAHSIT